MGQLDTGGQSQPSHGAFAQGAMMGMEGEKTSNPPSDSSLYSLSHEHKDEEWNPEYESTPIHLQKTATLSRIRSNNLMEGGTLSRALSRVRTQDSGVDPGPPPDGGLHAWTQAILAHLVIFNTWGFINSFGLFQTYYTTILKEPPSSISWIGSIQTFAPFFIGAFTGRATDAGYFKLTFLVGVLIQGIGIFMTSLCTKYWQVVLAQGLCVGIGNGMVFVPAVTICSTYFLKNRSLAIGVAAAGSATGGLVYPAIAENLLPKVGFGWTVRVMGFVMVSTMIISAMFLKPRIPPRKTGPIIEWAAFTELPYALYAIASFLMFFGLYSAFIYIDKYSLVQVLIASLPADFP